MTGRVNAGQGFITASLALASLAGCIDDPKVVPAEKPSVGSDAAGSSTTPDIFGRWELADQDQKGTLIVDRDGSFSLLTSDQSDATPGETLKGDWKLEDSILSFVGQYTNSGKPDRAQFKILEITQNFLVLRPTNNDRDLYFRRSE